MKLVQNNDPNLITQFVQAQSQNQFLQSYDWGEFQKKLGRTIYRFIVVDEEVAPIEEPTKESILGSLLIVKMPLPKGRSYYYIPRGPIVYLQTPVPDQNEMWQTIVRTLKKEFIKKDKALFLRVEPGINKKEKTDLRSILTSKYPVEYLPKTNQPETTLVLNLEPSQEELLNSMHQKTRYNIRLAEKKGIEITSGWAKKDADDFWQLLQQTAERDRFTPHPKDYYFKMIETLGGPWEVADASHVKLYRANYQGKTLAMNIMMSFGDTATYLHGASSNEGRNLMAPYLLQWQAIKDAKARKAKYYDFWGIAPTDNPKHPWAGITRFKKGFGGEVIRYWGMADIVYHSIWYLAYQTFRKFK